MAQPAFAAQDVSHNHERSRFELSVDGQLAQADYRREGNTLVFNHTFVPPALRGRGLAAAIVTAALDYARAEGYSVVPQCSYVAGFIERNRQYSDLLASGPASQ